MDYDISEGVDNEITLFSDKVSIPMGSIGPLTPKQLLGGSDIGETLDGYVTEDEDGYLVIADSNTSDEQYVLLIAYSILDQASPADIGIPDFIGTMEDRASVLETMGFVLSPQLFTLTAKNPLTEDIAISGKATLLSLANSENPAETLYSQEFSNVTVPAGSDASEILNLERDDWKALASYRIENLQLHLPASILEKDPDGGFGSFSVAYNYKSYLSLGSDIPFSIPVEIKDLDLPLGQYRVKEARICADVSNEIPVTLVLDSVDVLVKQTDDEGNVTIVPSEDVSVTPGITMASGSSGAPVVSPLEIIIKADEGTIPDISGLTLNLSVKVPTGAGDKRLNMNQAVYFNNLRATVSGGITFQGL